MEKHETLLQIINSVNTDKENVTREALNYCDEDHELNFSYVELFEAADQVCETLCSLDVENKVVAIAVGTSHHAVPSIILG